ncbi:MAG: hypothetical protein ACD_71C00106G0002 [uncultured bacterium (gcode 4)]|uniref:Uncharacterized protein n=1 Tax=uncultured bacterium (gcode 4) TaxID=1234023 RepID=K1YNJ5_9BACT|nr:MAG: hypothetical protein ACD_71C00106G0002 [uncultured bacterium (gcode 4)]
MNRLFFIVLFFCSSFALVFADSCTTGNMTVPHKCINASCTESDTFWVSRNTPGEIRAMLSWEKKMTKIENQNLAISDYCNNATLSWSILYCSSLWKTQTIASWKSISKKVYRVANQTYYKYDDGVDLLNQKRSNSNDSKNPLSIFVATCTTSLCNKTEEQSYSVFDDSLIEYYSGNISSFTMKEYDTPVITSVFTDESRKTTSSFSYGAFFMDRIPVWCNDTIYTYNPKVLKWNGWLLITEFTDSNTNNNPHITINKIGENMTGSIVETIKLWETGLRKIEMNVKDVGGNKWTKTTRMIEVIQWDVSESDSSLVSRQNTTTRYYPGDTIQYTIILKDIAGNIIKDKPASFSHPTQNTSISYMDAMPIYSDANTGEYTLRISINTPMSFIENFQVNFPYWDDWWVNITTWNPQIISLWNSSRIAIRDPNLAASDFIISCSQGPITLKVNCVRDNLSWCNNNKNESITFNSESDNGADGLLKAYDNAGNTKQYRYIMQHIDETMPTSMLKIGNTSIINNMSMLANNQQLSLWTGDVSPPGCGTNIYYSFVRPNNLWAGQSNFFGNIQAWQTLNFGTTNFTKSGTGRITHTLTDAVGNSSTGRKDIVIFPNFTNTITSSIVLVSSTRNSLYANNSSTYTYKLTLKDQFGNSIYGKSIFQINQEWGVKTVKTDMTNPNSPTGVDALSEQWVGWINTTNDNGEVFFTVKSVAPWVFSEKFKISMKTMWDNNYQDVGETQDIYIDSWNENSFKKPFIWELSVISSPYKLNIGTVLTMQLNIIKKENISEYVIEQFRDQLNISDSINQEIVDKEFAVSLNENPTIDFRIESRTDDWAKSAPGIIIQWNPIVSYTLWWQIIRFRLSTTDNASDLIYISLWGVVMNNTLKVVWSLQWQWKQTLVWQQNNFSDISKSDMRAIIRKNAYILIREMSSGQIINGVKYIEWDSTLSWEPIYETLIIKNGNLTISDNFNTNNKKFGIIVLRDDATKINFGNIYILPWVRYIHSVMYSDGGIISTGFWNDTIGNYKDSVTRTNILNRQLVIKGSLFTRNTIGWAIKGSLGKYILPWGSLTNDFNLAMMYDLNYLRRWNTWYDILGLNGSKNYNNENSDNVVIIFDSNSQTNPPKGFKN